MLHATVGRFQHFAASAAMIALVLFVGSCSDDSPTEPEDPNSIEAQIKALFPPGASTRDAALTQIADIRQQIAANATAQARSKTLTLVDFTVTSFREGKLVGGTSATAGNAASRLVNSLYQLVGMAPPNLPEGALSSDGAAKVVGPEGALIVTPSGAAGVQIPAGAISEQVLVTVTRLPAPPTPGTGPLPTTLKQYPPYYDFATYPAVAQFGDSLRVGICQVTDPTNPLYPPEPHERLRLAHTVGASIQILERVGVDDFLRCTNVSASAAPTGSWRATLSALANRAIGRITPVSLYAAHGGLGGKVKSFSPFGAVDPGAPLAALSLGVGMFHTCAVNVIGAAYCWGYNANGQLGNGTTTTSSVPVPVSGGLTFTSISAGLETTCALASGGAAYCWGMNGSAVPGGALGNGTTANSSTPVRVSGDLAFAAISVGGRVYACGLTLVGGAYCWGRNDDGELGNGTTTGATVPVAVSGGLTFKSISAGLAHTCGLTTDGTAYCWGWNAFRQLGSGSSDTRVLVPTAVTGGLKFTSITAGLTTTCGISGADTYCWGEDFFGSLGAGTTGGGSRPAPSKIVGGNTFTSVQASKANDVLSPTCALTAAGAAYCWGANDTGQLGTTAPLSTCTLSGPSFGCTGTPVPVAGGLIFDVVIPGAQHTCGLARDGRAYCWGDNTRSQLGNGGADQSNIPVAVAGGIIVP